MRAFVGQFERAPIRDKMRDVRGYIVVDNIAVDSSCVRFTQNGVKVFFWGHLYNGGEVSRVHGVSAGLDAPALISALYERASLGAFAELEGEFTVIIIADREVVVCRDHRGGCHQVFFGDQFFASSLAEFRLLKDFGLSLNERGLSEYLRRGYISGPQTALRGVQKLGGGECLVWSRSGLRISQRFPFEQGRLLSGRLSVDEAAEEYGRLHREAIARRIRGEDVVGVLLSGGYDSGGNLAALREIWSREVHTYSVGFRGSKWSELGVAEVMARRFRTTHKTYEMDGSEMEELPTLVSYLGDPFMECGLMVNYAAMRMASGGGAGVILGGDGNDQQFGTFGRRLALHYALESARAGVLQSGLDRVLDRSMFKRWLVLFRLWYYNWHVLHAFDGDCYGFSRNESRRIVTSEFRSAVDCNCRAVVRRAGGFDELCDLYNCCVDNRLINEVIVFKSARAALMFNKQCTFPFLDNSVHAFVKTLPRRFRTAGSVLDILRGAAESKFIHTRYFRKRLPQEVTSRTKQGGFVPLRLFLDDASRRDRFREILLDSGLTRDVLRRAAVERFVKGCYDVVLGEERWFWHGQLEAFKFLVLLNLAVWWEVVIKGREVRCLSDL